MESNGFAVVRCVRFVFLSMNNAAIPLKAMQFSVCACDIIAQQINKCETKTANGQSDDTRVGRKWPEAFYESVICSANFDNFISNAFGCFWVNFVRCAQIPRHHHTFTQHKIDATNLVCSVRSPWWMACSILTTTNEECVGDSIFDLLEDSIFEITHAQNAFFFFIKHNFLQQYHISGVSGEFRISGRAEYFRFESQNHFVQFFANLSDINLFLSRLTLGLRVTMCSPWRFVRRIWNEKITNIQ